jgi:hypothetical protein
MSGAIDTHVTVAAVGAVHRVEAMVSALIAPIAAPGGPPRATSVAEN